MSRHGPTVRYLRERGIAPAECAVIEHTTTDDVRGRRVIGNLPLALAALAERVTTVPLPRPRRDAQARTEQLTIDEVRAGAGKPETYRVERLPRGDGTAGSH